MVVLNVSAGVSCSSCKMRWATPASMLCRPCLADIRPRFPTPRFHEANPTWMFEILQFTSQHLRDLQNISYRDAS